MTARSQTLAHADGVTVEMRPHAGRPALPQAALGRGFALVVAAVAVFLLIDTVALGGPPGR